VGLAFYNTALLEQFLDCSTLISAVAEPGSRVGGGYGFQGFGDCLIQSFRRSGFGGAQEVL
jgi:hypothetical protein